MTKTRVYKSWTGMRYRCSPENEERFPLYSGRGITVHPSWDNSFEEFYEYIGDPPDDRRWSIERIDNDGNYEPGNITWALPHKQNRNRTIFRNNPTGVTGITQRIRNGIVRWIARWYDLNGKSCSKSFLESKYDNAFDEACNYRLEMINLLISEGAEYSDKHGR